MRKYTIVNGELYHANHKYIKRVWKNGRWQYTYDVKGVYNDAKKQVNKAMDKAEKNLSKSVAKAEYGVNKAKNNINTTFNKAKTKASSVANNVYDKLGLDDKKAAESAKKAAESKKGKFSEKIAKNKADKLAEKYGSTPVGKMEAAAKNGKAALDKAFSGVKSAASDLKNKAKDVMGYDERDRYNVAKARADHDVKNYEAYDKTRRARFNTQVRLAQNGKATGEELNKRWDRMNERERQAKDKARVSESVANTRLNEYKKTPLYKVENAKNKTKEFIDDIGDNLERLVKKRKKN